MRPRVFPAEDPRWTTLQVCESHGASMRPRVFPAEDVDVREATAPDGSRASMRPRVFPAEDPRWTTLQVCESHGASMRPRVFPAEDLWYGALNAITGELRLQ